MAAGVNEMFMSISLNKQARRITIKWFHINFMNCLPSLPQTRASSSHQPTPSLHFESNKSISLQFHFFRVGTEQVNEWIQYAASVFLPWFRFTLKFWRKLFCCFQFYEFSYSVHPPVPTMNLLLRLAITTLCIIIIKNPKLRLFFLYGYACSIVYQVDQSNSLSTEFHEINCTSCFITAGVSTNYKIPTGCTNVSLYCCWDKNRESSLNALHIIIITQNK